MEDKNYLQRKYFKVNGVYICEEKVFVAQSQALCSIGSMYINAERKGELD